MLKILELQKQLDEKRSALKTLEEKDTDFSTRSAEFEKRVNEATTETTAEEKQALENEVASFNEEKAEHENAKGTLRGEIENLEKELEEEEAKHPQDEPKEENKRTLGEIKKMEVRESKEYINAFANYIKTEKDAEVRSLLSTNGTDAEASLTGYVPVPVYLEQRIKTAWEQSNVMSLVKKTYLRGNVKVGFELSATGAVVHKEGHDAPDEEVITIGIIEMIPQSIKKWITISDEALDLSGEEFLNYIYDELTYRIAHKAEEILVDMITSAGTTATSSAVSVPQLETAPALDTVVKALAKLQGEARNITLLMSRGTFASFRAVQQTANFAMDIFEGQKVVFTDVLPDFDTADEEDVYMIVGDFGLGAQANFPNGFNIGIKVDDKSLAEKDLVKFVGREFVGMGIVADRAFVNVVKPSLTE